MNNEDIVWNSSSLPSSHQSRFSMHLPLLSSISIRVGALVPIQKQNAILPKYVRCSIQYPMNLFSHHSGSASLLTQAYRSMRSPPSSSFSRFSLVPRSIAAPCAPLPSPPFFTTSSASSSRTSPKRKIPFFSSIKPPSRSTSRSSSSAFAFCSPSPSTGCVSPTLSPTAPAFPRS